MLLSFPLTESELVIVDDDGGFVADSSTTSSGVSIVKRPDSSLYAQAAITLDLLFRLALATRSS